MDVNNVVVVSDTHCGDQGSICPRGGIRLFDGGRYSLSPVQRKLIKYWEVFWNEFVPYATRKERYAVVHNGDLIDGLHHKSVYQVSPNLEDQSEIAYQLMAPIVDRCKGQYYQVRGTEAHTGSSGVEEERLAKRLGAIRERDTGNYSRFELWKRVGPKTAHFLHHIGGAKTALYNELETMYIEAAKWGHKPPHMIVRSHMHQYSCFEMPVESPGTKDMARGMGHAMCVVTPSWQNKTPFVWKVTRGRVSLPQFGGIVIRYTDNELFLRRKIWTLGRRAVE